MHFAKHARHRRLATTLMMAAALAFVLQGMFVAVSEAATGDSSHYYLGFAFKHDGGVHHSHLVTHRHADGTVHTHAIDDDDGALAKHLKQPGCNMAMVICVVPALNISALSVATGQKLEMANPRRLTVAALDGLRRPPRPPCIA